MAKPCLLLDGYLTKDLPADSTKLYLDAGSLAYLIALADDTYVELNGEAGVEVAKVVAVNGVFASIVRAQEYTEALDFIANDSCQYTITVAEIEQSIPSVSVTMYPYGGIRIVGNTIEYPKLNFTHLGATETVGEHDIHIGRDENAYGCCDGNEYPYPIDGPPLQLTSTIFPIEALDSYNLTISILKAAFIPRVTDSIESAVSMLGGTIRDTLYAGYGEDNIESAVDLLDGELDDILISYDGSSGGGADRPEDFYFIQIAPQGGDINDVLITYTHPPEDNYQLTILPQGGTLV